MRTIVVRCIKVTLVVSFCILCLQYWLENKSYIFTPESVAKIARKYVGEDPEYAFRSVYKEFARKYQGHILHEKDLQWIFMNSGGWMGGICLLHASITEYVLFFGTAIDTSGHSGRYWANISDTILTGKFRQWTEGSLTSRVYGPGDTVHHTWGEATGVSFSAGTWMVEYGRGFIPSTLTFALADTFFGTTDFVTLFYILRVYFKALLLEAGNSFQDLRQLLKESF